MRPGLLLLCVLFSSGILCGAKAQDSLSQVMALRYAPFAKWEAHLVLPDAPKPTGRYWKSAAEIAALREVGARPLSGLKLVLDPGHIGGVWAEHEGRNFRINDNDYWVREGELVLIVAMRVQEQLQALGADVVLLRDSIKPVNPRKPVHYLESAFSQVGEPKDSSFAGLTDHLSAVRDNAVRRSIVIGDLAERARLVNQVIQPDAVISLHINAARWPVMRGEDGVNREVLQLVEGNHVHVLTFGCMSDTELRSSRQRKQLMAKLSNGSGAAEVVLGRALAQALQEATGLPASQYEGNNAIVDDENPYLWFRNLMLLRSVECPVVLLEPYVANSTTAYARIQAALRARMAGSGLLDDDILEEYAEAVVNGVLNAYRIEQNGAL